MFRHSGHVSLTPESLRIFVICMSALNGANQNRARRQVTVVDPIRLSSLGVRSMKFGSHNGRIESLRGVSRNRQIPLGGSRH
jgi:hypothetical protein